MLNVRAILNSFKTLILNIIIYKHIFLKLKIKFINFIKVYIKIQSELYKLHLLTRI